MTDWTLYIGQPVCWGRWHGILQDVFVSPVTGKTLVQIYFVKNAYKQQQAEIVPVIDILRRSTPEELGHEVEHFETMLRSTLEHHKLSCPTCSPQT
jgi:hypothetical protein